METHYQILGVHNQSDAASIRTAYLALVKRYHPDVASNRETAAGDLIRINVAYSVLRNPASRAAYDAALFQARKLPQTLPRNDRRASAISRRRRRFLWRGLWAGCVGAALLFLAHGTGLVGFGAGDIVDDANGPPRSGPRSLARQDAKSIEINPRVQDAVAFATELSSSEAKAASRHCFDQRNTYPSLSIADQCIAFDLAFATAQPASGDPYFESRAMIRRHLAALMVLDSAQDRTERLKAIAAKTHSALVGVLTAKSEGIPPPAYSPAVFPQ